MYFKPSLLKLSRQIDNFSQEDIREEPQLFNCDLEHAYKLGGPIVRNMLDCLPPDWHDEPVVVDTKVHMLKLGWWPCIPGWHLDDVHRNTLDGQPNFYTPEYRSHHAISIVGADIAPTEFLIEPVNIVINRSAVRGSVYSQAHNQIELIKEKFTMKVSDRCIYLFDDRTWHRCTQAVSNGWRWFGRVSRYTHAFHGHSIPRPNPRTNEVRTQTQVYIQSEGKGW